jgi:hypothetical protein
MGGWKASGVGTRHGAGGILKYTKSQTILLTGLAPNRDVHQFPYSPRRSRMLAAAMRRLYGRKV